MRFRKDGLGAIALFLIVLSAARSSPTVTAATGRNPIRVDAERPAAPEVDLITVEELKTRLERNEPLTIIDVRSAKGFSDSSTKIKGAIHVKLRRLRYRLTLPPLKSVPRDRETVTYCACPNDEASIEAAQVMLTAGFKRVRVLKGGWRVWLKANGPVEARPRT